MIAYPAAALGFSGNSGRQRQIKTNTRIIMPQNPPYVPSRDADLGPWSDNFSTVLAADEAAYGLVPADSAAVAAVVTPWLAALALATNPATRTAATVAAKDAAKSAMLAVVRPYAVRIAGNPAVSDDDKVTIGVTVRNTGRTPIPPPTVAPVLSLDSLIIGQAKLRYANPDIPAGKAKGYGIKQVEVAVTLGTAVSVDPDGSTRREPVTKAPFALPFGPEARGKVATVWARFRTLSGPGGLSQAGPWSASLSFTLP